MVLKLSQAVDELGVKIMIFVFEEIEFFNRYRARIIKIDWRLREQINQPTDE